MSKKKVYTKYVLVKKTAGYHIIHETMKYLTRDTKEEKGYHKLQEKIKIKLEWKEMKGNNKVMVHTGCQQITQM